MNYAPLFARCDDLQAQCSEVALAAAGTWAEPSVKAAWSNALRLDAERIERLRETGDLGQKLVGGTLTPQKWCEIANITGADLNAIAAALQADSVSVGRFWKEVVWKTVEDAGGVIKGAAQSVQDEGIPLVKWLVVGLVALAVLQVTRVLK